MSKTNAIVPDGESAKALAALCAGVLPIWLQHLATSRAQSEVAVTEMLQAFADIDPHINMAERQSQQITDALNQSDSGVTSLTNACKRTLTPLLESGNLPAGGAQAIAEVLQMVEDAVTALESIAKPFTHETKMVAAQVERMYIGFQYQDRISQMMSLLEGDISRLQEALKAGGGADLPTLDAWLTRLESQYAMAEQHKVHSEQTGVESGHGDSKETTFF